MNHNHSFIKENARNIIPKLRKNLLIDTSFGQREKKFIHIAHMNINGNAIFATSRLSQTTHKSDDVIHVPTLDQRITANADVKDNIQVQTNANTRTETTLELSNIVVIKIQLQKDFNLDEVNFFNKFLNHQ
jgi:viroplasmin and RNaseH domain-containing protein